MATTLAELREHMGHIPGSETEETYIIPCRSVAATHITNLAGTSATAVAVNALISLVEGFGMTETS